MDGDPTAVMVHQRLSACPPRRSLVATGAVLTSKRIVVLADPPPPFFVVGCAVFSLSAHPVFRPLGLATDYSVAPLRGVWLFPGWISGAVWRSKWVFCRNVGKGGGGRGSLHSPVLEASPLGRAQGCCGAVVDVPLVWRTICCMQSGCLKADPFSRSSARSVWLPSILMLESTPAQTWQKWPFFFVGTPKVLHPVVQPWGKRRARAVRVSWAVGLTFCGPQSLGGMPARLCCTLRTGTLPGRTP